MIVNIIIISFTESLNLFKSRFPNNIIINNIISILLDTLEHIPLTITQAKLYIY